MVSSFDRSKKRIQLWKKALFHFSLCFIMGFFTGFAPTSTASIFPSYALSERMARNLLISPEPLQASIPAVEVSNASRSLMSENLEPSEPPPPPPPHTEEVHLQEAGTELVTRKNLIVITTMRPDDRIQRVFMRRLANTLKLVPPPLLWIVVEPLSDSSKTAAILRETGIMYRHLVYRENFTDPEAEVDHQRNVALSHIEHHHLVGIVHFAIVSNVYNLRFFEEIRDIEVFGAWPIALVSEGRRRVLIEGPICRSSQVVGWKLGDKNQEVDQNRFPLHISAFAFNSSILWDPERWGRPSSVPDTSQDSIKFVRQVVLEDETKLRAIPPDCSNVLMWHVHIPVLQPRQSIPLQQNQSQYDR
ncbi:putative beta-1,4-xylosyltransferase IRX9 [Acorus calamus]|uniref:Glycosyltransferases n=1 Tax=Acorus calamus TaxID=4465 RepID=A0AAV9F8T7_ACOCL|nr:putative beta-1,4-xylosyltransferase IRX9 [Acorus calamus]